MYIDKSPKGFDDSKMIEEVLILILQECVF